MNYPVYCEIESPIQSFLGTDRSPEDIESPQGTDNELSPGKQPSVLLTYSRTSSYSIFQALETLAIQHILLNMKMGLLLYQEVTPVPFVQV